MKPLNQPPLQQPISDKEGFIDRIWFGFFLQLWQMFSAPSFGAKTLTLIDTGITGVHTTEYDYVTDRNFVWFSIVITPTTTMTSLNGTISGLNDLPIESTNISISLEDTGVTIDSRNSVLGIDGIIHLPDFSLTSYKVIISGKYLKVF
jgi:hypothetical protein